MNVELPNRLKLKRTVSFHFAYAFSCIEGASRWDDGHIIIDVANNDT
jgi:hypothetical protein